MVKYSLDSTFSALAHTTRRAILSRLAHSEATITELAAPFAVSLPAVLKHLDVLEGAGLVERTKEGRVCRCRLSARPMKEAGKWIEQYRDFWEAQFDSLDRYLSMSRHKETKR